MGGGEAEGAAGELDLMNVFRILALGGSICRVLRGSEALGGLSLTKLCPRVGPLKKDLTCVGGSELGSYEDLMNVSRILAPGGSFCRILRGSEALGGTMSNGPLRLGGSDKEDFHVRGG